MALLQLDKEGNILETYATEDFFWLQYLNYGYFVGYYTITDVPISWNVSIFAIRNGAVHEVKKLYSMDLIPINTTFGGLTWNKKNYYWAWTYASPTYPVITFYRRLEYFNEKWKLIKTYTVETNTLLGVYRGLVHDGKNIWAIISARMLLNEIEIDTYKPVKSFSISYGLIDPRDVTTDRKNFWVSYAGGSAPNTLTVVCWDKEGNALDTFAIPGTVNEAIMTDGKHLYVS